MNWIPISERIPEYQYEVEVQDEHGNIGIGECCYYHLKVGRNISGQKWGSEIIYLEKPEHDGSWMILANCNLLSPLVGSVTFWREKNDKID